MSSKIRIAVVSSTVFPCPPPGYAGLEMIAWQCAKGLAELGHQVSLVAPDGSHCPGVAVVPTGPPGRWDEAAAYGGFPEMKEGDKVLRSAHPGYWQHLLEVDVVVCHDWQKWAYVLKMEGRLKAPILAVMHAPVNTMYATLPPVEKPCFVCISQDQADHFEALFGRPARVARNGINTDFYRATNIPRNDRFLFLARFSSIKGPHIALDCCREADVGLDLVGDRSITQEPDYYNLCERKAAENPKARIIGPASRGECVSWFSGNHVLLHPNKTFREPAGLAPLEAQAVGMPVIAWRYGAMKETVRLGGETGWLVESEKEMMEIVQAVRADRGVVDDAMRKRCREWVCDTYTEQGMVKRYEELCHEALSGGW